MESSQIQIGRCEVCGNHDLTSVLDLGKHPMCDDLVPVSDSRVCNEYPIEILYCKACRTAHQRFQIPKQDLFPPNYHYRSHMTADVLTGMRQFTTACDDFCKGLEGKAVVDVGCNDGSLLSMFREKGARTFGIEPTGAAADARANGHMVLNEFFSEDVAIRFVAEFGHPDIITLTNVFAHIEDLPAVLRAFKIMRHTETVIVIENHYLGAILDRRQFDTFYHEHPRTYSYRSFSVIAETLGMRISDVQFPSRYGGNIRVFLSPAGESAKEHALWQEMDDREQHFEDDLLGLGEAVDLWRHRKSQELQAAFNAHGPLKAKAFPGRSAIPIKLLGVTDKMFSAVYEKPASGKISHYVPGTRIPIKSDDELEIALETGPVVNLAWHIADEIKTYMCERGYRGPIIDIIASTDFQK